MPRNVYHQSPGNPIQLDRLPDQPLELEFAHYRGIDNDDGQMTLRVLRELVFVSCVGLAAFWVASFVASWPPLALGLVVLLTINIWRSLASQRTTIHILDVPLILAAWIYHSFELPLHIEITVAAVAMALLTREIVRHYVFVATVSPMEVEKAWQIRESTCWLTVLTATFLFPIALGLCVPWLMETTLTLSGLIWIGIRHAFVKDPGALWPGFCDSLRSWCCYNLEDTPIPGLLKSPSGPCSRRQRWLVIVVLLNAFALARLTFDGHGFVGGPRSGSTVAGMTSLPWLVQLLFAALALFVWSTLPVLSLLVALFVVGGPVFGRFRLPKPGVVSAGEWQQITERLRNSTNPVERDSLYLGRLVSDQSPLLVPSSVFREHAHFLGDSGSGKTARGLAPLLAQVLSSGKASVMVIDLKGDSQELLQTLRHGANAARKNVGKNVPVRYFTTRDDEATFAFNPFQLSCWNRLNDFQKTDILCGALGLVYGTDYGEGYFSSANASVLHAAVKHFPDVKTFDDLSDKIGYVIARPKAHGLDDKAKDAGNHVRMSVVRLAAFAALNVAPGRTPSDAVLQESIDPSRLFERPEAHYFHLSATLGPGSSPEIGRLAAYMLLTSATLTKRKVPVYLIIDEFQRMASRNLDYLLQLGRSMDVAVVLANQSMQDLKRSDLIPTLETNCRYRQWFAVSGWEDQDQVSKASGETVDVLESKSVTRSQNGKGSSTSHSQSQQQFIGPRLTKNDIKLVSDDDRKSIVLVNRGAGYAQYGGMPIVVESDFHISEQEFDRRKDTPWPSGEPGTFVPQDWSREIPIPHRRGRGLQGPVMVTQEIIPETVAMPTLSEPGPANRLTQSRKTDSVDSTAPQSTVPQPPPATRSSRKKKRRSRKSPHRPVSNSPTTADPFARYLAEHPISSEPVDNADRVQEEER